MSHTKKKKKYVFFNKPNSIPMIDGYCLFIGRDSMSNNKNCVVVINKFVIRFTLVENT